MAVDKGPDDRLMVRYCAHPDGHAPKDCPDNRPYQGPYLSRGILAQNTLLLALRERWAEDPNR